MRRFDILTATAILALSITSTGVILLDATNTRPTVQGAFDSPLNDSLAPETEYEIGISPRKIELEPLQQYQFKLYRKLLNGDLELLPAELVTWQVVNGGGTINSQGVFQAWELSGDYPNTISARFGTRSVTASVRIKTIQNTDRSGSEDAPTAIPTPSPVDGNPISTTAPTPTTSRVNTTIPTPTTSRVNTTIPTPTTSRVNTTIPTPIPTVTESIDDLVGSIVTQLPTDTPPPLIEGDELTNEPTEEHPSPTPTPKPTLRLYPWEKRITPFPTKKPVITPPPTQSPTPRPTVNPTDVQYYRTESVEACLKDLLGEETYTTYFTADKDRPPLSELSDYTSGMERCYQVNKVEDIDITTKTCLVTQLGQVRYDEIATGKSGPTNVELSRASTCYSKPRIITYFNETIDDVDVHSCLNLKIGEDRLEILRTGQDEPTQAEITAGRECFTLDEPVTRPPLVIDSPRSLTTCLTQVLGDRYTEVIVDKKQATEAERIATQPCFDEFNKDQALFLPAPPQKLPFIQTSPEDINIAEIVTNTQVAEQTTYTLTGHSSVPNATIDVYVFSEPIVFTTRTDENGDWFYELSYHLDDGEHKAYSVVQHPEKGIVKSEVSIFSVALAETAEAAESTQDLVVVQEPVSQSVRDYIIVSVVAVLFAGFFLTTLAHIKASKHGL